MTVITPGGPARAIAHRGEPIGHRENTLHALTAALDLGADLVEIDVKVTADGAVVLLHDNTLDRIWGDPARIDDVTFADLPQLTDADDGIPLLSDALSLIAGSGASLLIDMDASQLAEPTLAVVRGMIATDGLDPAEVAWCGALGALETVRQQDGDARIFLTWTGSEPPPDDLTRRLAPEAVNPKWTTVGADTISWAHDRGLAACCWTVDDEDDMTALLDRGIDAVISNRIGTLRGVLDARA